MEGQFKPELGASVCWLLNYEHLRIFHWLLWYKLDCPSMNKQKGGSVNISDAFESYGLSHSSSLSLTSDITIRWQVLSPSVRLVMRNDLMLFVMRVRVLVHVVECILPTLWALLSRLVLQNECCMKHCSELGSRHLACPCPILRVRLHRTLVSVGVTFFLPCFDPDMQRRWRSAFEPRIIWRTY